MTDSRPPIYLALGALLIAGVTAFFFFQGPSDSKEATEPAPAALGVAPTESVNPVPAEVLSGQGDPAPATPDTAGAQLNPDAAANQQQRPTRAQRRAARMMAYNNIPAEKRARTLAERWKLTKETEQELAEILARYSEQYDALAKQTLSEADRAAALRQLQSSQVGEIMPIVAESPALQGAMQKFIEAGEARGGTLVKP